MQYMVMTSYEAGITSLFSNRCHLGFPIFFRKPAQMTQNQSKPIKYNNALMILKCRGTRRGLGLPKRYKFPFKKGKFQIWKNMPVNIWFRGQTGQ